MIKPVQITHKPFYVTIAKKGITATQVRLALGLSTATLAKIAKNEPLAMSVYLRMCRYLDCDLSDIIAIIKDDTTIIQYTLDYNAGVQGYCPCDSLEL